MTISFFEDIFKYEKFPVEYECYKQLKALSHLNYVAIPWTQILNSHWLEFPGRQHRDFYFRELSKVKLDQQNNFTVCQHDSYMQLRDYLHHLNITKIFACATFDYDKLEGIDIISMPYINTFNFKNCQKDILISFIGSVTDDCRQKIKTNIQGSHIIFRDTYHITSDFFTKETKNKEEIEYNDILSRSRFSLCPRGSNPNSVRFWESLAAGAIPILISDNYNLPQWDWDNTIIKIKEKEIATYDYKKISNFLSNIKNESLLRENCLRAYSYFSKENYKNYITSNLT